MERVPTQANTGLEWGTVAPWECRIMLPSRPLHPTSSGATVVTALAVSHLAVRISFLTAQFACNSCSMCATKSGSGKVGPIYGVFMLDPCRGSPLKLVKHLVRNRGAKLEGGSFSSQHPDLRINGTLIVNTLEYSSTLQVTSQRRRTRVRRNKELKCREVWLWTGEGKACWHGMRWRE